MPGLTPCSLFQKYIIVKIVKNMSNKKDINRNTWNSLAKMWALQTAPWRPTKKEIDIYEVFLKRALKNKKNPKVLILGATPELRDLCAKLEIKSDIIDVNPNMIRAMTELLEISDGKEKVYIGNWMDMPFSDNQYDLLMCDHGMQHIPYDKWKIFFKEIKRILKPEGFFINSVFSLEKCEKISISDVIKIYKNTLFSREYKYYYMNRLIFSLPDYKNVKGLKDCGLINPKLKNKLKKNIISKRDYEFLKVPSPIDKFKVNIASKEDVDRETLKYFIIKSIKTNIEHPDFAAHKIYYLKNKQYGKI
jgi:SAM-dependent methyltransferase